MDELTECIAACKADGFDISVTYYVHEIWKQSEALSATESFQELMSLFMADCEKMQSLESKLPGAAEFHAPRSRARANQIRRN